MADTGEDIKGSINSTFLQRLVKTSSTFYSGISQVRVPGLRYIFGCIICATDANPKGNFAKSLQIEIVSGEFCQVGYTVRKAQSSLRVIGGFEVLVGQGITPGRHQGHAVDRFRVKEGEAVDDLSAPREAKEHYLRVDRVTDHARQGLDQAVQFGQEHFVVGGD